DRFFVRTLLELARHLDVLVVAEWVHDEAAARILADWGVDFLQGELFDMPELAQQEPAAPLPATGTD
ncbi:MAG: EAL domain-containing protein, partial [Alsobacter sp.]